MNHPDAELRSPRLSEELEDRLGPSKYLGYDRDHLGIALLRKEMFEAAESQFRRAAYLNPYEASFKQHLAWCLYRMERFEDALALIEAAIRQNPEDTDALIAREKIREGLEKNTRNRFSK
jgi:tetratricopeptide (TPR) repeat protein